VEDRAKVPYVITLVLLVLVLMPVSSLYSDSGEDKKAIEHILEMFEKACLEEDMDLLAD
jgi:hypothetical protein